MKISAFEVRIGSLLEHNGKLWRVLKKQHVKPGKGGAFVQLEMKELNAGTKLNERFRSDDKVEKPHVEVHRMQYLYLDGDSYVFMDSNSFEQINIPADDLAEQIKYLLPNTDVQVTFHNESPIGLDLPSNVVLEVTATDAAIKGQTAAGGGKPATLETGLVVTVPTFINIGDKLKINTDTGEYVERA